MKIKKLRLKSKHLEKQKAFYVNQLGFELLEASNSFFSIRVGETHLSFEKSNEALYYHFAFNIPSFQIKEAADWLEKQDIKLMEYEASCFVKFESWNADAIYFYDSDGNIVEFIARKNLEIISDQPFSINSILNVSEIGMPVVNVNEMYQHVLKYPGLQQYSGDQHYFCTMGDEHGLFLIVDQNTKKWMPTDLPAIPAAFQMEMSIDGKDYTFKYPLS